ncbi:TetR/AcrR family transcriptional regulator [Hyphomonas sp.]|uniref:TetR/AcrR family transcriptional regulator n=1 Tax=Hyphomonas sp. TaxID=87 RepID=UPI0025C60954|nr:TetR/AcrR family transcriptional regulator [Hyphomonas sp.]
MGRKSTFLDRDIFEAAGLQIAKDGEFRIQRLVEQTGVSTGSLYHRYGSREGLIASAWVDALEAFSANLLPELMAEDSKAGERAALVTPTFARRERAKAIILASGRQSQFLTGEASAELRARAQTINDNIAKAVAAFSKRETVTLEAARYGTMAFPLAVVMTYLPQKRVPKSADDFILAAYRSAMTTGRRAK